MLKTPVTFIVNVPETSTDSLVESVPVIVADENDDMGSEVVSKAPLLIIKLPVPFPDRPAPGSTNNSPL